MALGAGERLFDDLDRALDDHDCVELAASARVAHVVLARRR